MENAMLNSPDINQEIAMVSTVPNTRHEIAFKILLECFSVFLGVFELDLLLINNWSIIIVKYKPYRLNRVLQMYIYNFKTKW